ncbi:MAG: cold shock domain-containing protein [Streptosporangiaceae bacterium]
MLTGKVVQFDDIRGYGFIAPDKGGEDVFVHANVLADDKLLFVPGLPVEFEVTEGDRGLKAYAVHVLRDQMETAVPAPKPIPVPRAPALPAPVATRVAASSHADDEEDLCDVLTALAFRQELMDLLLESEPTLTAAQIKQLLQSLIELGARHGWVEN